MSRMSYVIVFIYCIADASTFSAARSEAIFNAYEQQLEQVRRAYIHRNVERPIIASILADDFSAVKNLLGEQDASDQSLQRRLRMLRLTSPEQESGITGMQQIKNIASIYALSNKPNAQAIHIYVSQFSEKPSQVNAGASSTQH